MKSSGSEQGIRLKHSKRAQYKKKIREAALFMSTVMDFFECAAEALENAAYGKDRVSEPRTNSNLEEAQEQTQLKVALQSVRINQGKMRSTYFDLLKLDSTYIEYSASVLQDRLASTMEMTEGLVKRTQHASSVTIIPTGTEKQSSSIAKKVVGGLIMLAASVSDPYIQTKQWLVDFQEQTSRSELAFVAPKNQFTSIAERGIEKRDSLEKQKWDTAKNVSGTADKIGKRLFSGPSNPNIRWVCYVPMRRQRSGNEVRGIFGITQAKLKLTAGGWSTHYE